ncbi:hypothetical protein LCGC14_1551630 [marine sediment metagenome]|uniref:Uncharacterized protein n=1 Tax=marine sediment metagenome TaxID=412755 RepID=A0A0F9JB38_9ZZZZ
MSRHRALLRLHPDALVVLFQQSKDGRRFKIPENSLPEDVNFLGVNYDPQYNCFMISLDSEEFDKVPDGNVLPILEQPVIETTAHPHMLESHLWNILRDLGFTDEQIEKDGFDSIVHAAREKIKASEELLAAFEEE